MTPEERRQLTDDIGAKIKAPLSDARTDTETWPTATELGSLGAAFAFADIWSRPGLDLKTRSLITVAILTATNRPDHLRIHVNGALNNGATPDEIFETVAHAGVYSGMPASSTGFAVTKQVLAARDRHPDQG